jgi:hypothetical protein
LKYFKTQVSVEEEMTDDSNSRIITGFGDKKPKKEGTAGQSSDQSDIMVKMSDIEYLAFQTN